MKEIPLTRGYVALVDDADFERVNAHKWQAKVYKRRTGSVYIYAMRSVRKNGKRTTELLHRFLNEGCGGLFVDHIDGNGLNNTRLNMRVCTNAENLRNSNSSCGTSKYKGVTWHKQKKMWCSHIRVDRKLKHLGCFKSETDAALAYNAAALVLFGEYSRINNVESENFDGQTPEWAVQACLEAEAKRTGGNA